MSTASRSPLRGSLTFLMSFFHCPIQPVCSDSFAVLCPPLRGQRTRRAQALLPRQMCMETRSHIGRQKLDIVDPLPSALLERRGRMEGDRRAELLWAETHGRHVVRAVRRGSHRAPRRFQLQNRHRFVMWNCSSVR